MNSTLPVCEPSSGMAAGISVSSSSSSPASPSPFSVPPVSPRKPRIAVIGDVEDGDRLGGVVNVARLVVALGATPALFIAATEQQADRIRNEFPDAFWMFFCPGRAPDIETLVGVLSSLTPAIDGALIGDYTCGTFPIDLQIKLTAAGFPWRIRHFNDSFQRSGGQWEEAIKFAADLRSLLDALKTV